MRRGNPKKKFSDFAVTSALNQWTYQDFFNQMYEIYLNCHRLNHLPSSMNQRFIEKTLFERGSIAVFEDEYLGLISLPYNQAGKPDIYDDPKRIYVYSTTGYHRYLKSNEFVIIWANESRVPPVEYVELMAWRMYEVQRTIDVNLQNQKNPKVLKGPEGQKLTIDNLMLKVNGNVPYIPVKKDFKIEVEALDLSSPFIVDKLVNYQHELWNTFLTWCGIENANRDKRERMVAEEVNANYGNVEMSRKVGMDARQTSWKRVNERFGTQVEVIFNSEIPTLLNQGLPEG